MTYKTIKTQQNFYKSHPVYCTTSFVFIQCCLKLWSIMGWITSHWIVGGWLMIRDQYCRISRNTLSHPSNADYCFVWKGEVGQARLVVWNHCCSVGFECELSQAVGRFYQSLIIQLLTNGWWLICGCTERGCYGLPIC